MKKPIDILVHRSSESKNLRVFVWYYSIYSNGNLLNYSQSIASDVKCGSKYINFELILFLFSSSNIYSAMHY
jgi:hypothetical protein